MQATPFIDELTAKLRQLAATSPARDVEKNLRALLSAGLARLDVVTREDGVVRINGGQVARLKRVSSRGEPLAPGPTGRIPEGCYYLGTEHKDGLDSRYADIGFVCAKSIIGTGDSLL